MSYPWAPYPPERWSGEHGEVSARFRPAGSEPDLRYPNGGTVHYLASGSGTDGDFGLYRWTFGEGVSGPDPHVHRTMSESFYILSGTVRLHDGTGWRDAHPGDFAYVPPGGIHGFRNESGEPASMLILFAPGAPREGYFEGLAALGRGDLTLTEEERAEFYRKHDNLWVDGG